MSASNPWDFSNILLANQGGQAIGQGLANIGAEGGKALRQYGENKFMANQSIGRFEGAVKANPELLAHLNDENTNPEVKKTFSKLQKDGTVGLSGAAVLAAYADSYVLNKHQQQLAQLQAAQTQATQASTAENVARTALTQQQTQAAQLEYQQHLNDYNAFQKLIGGTPFEQNQQVAPSAGGAPMAGAAPQAQSTIPPMLQKNPQAVQAVVQGTVSPEAQAIASFAKPGQGTGNAFTDWYRHHVESTGMRPTPEMTNQVMGKIINAEKPLGAVTNGEVALDENKNPVQIYYPLIQKGQSIEIDRKSPIKIPQGSTYGGNLYDIKSVESGKPTLVPDATAGKDAQGNPIPGGQPAIRYTEPQKKYISETSTALNQLTNSLKDLNALEKIHENIASNRWSAFSDITSLPLIKSLTGKVSGNNAGELFDSLASKFSTDILSNTKNLRSAQEFNKAIEQLPSYKQSNDTRGEILYGMKDKILRQIQQLSVGLDNVKKGATPESADEAAFNIVNKPILDAMMNQPNPPPASKAKRESKAAAPAGKLPSGWALHP